MLSLLASVITPWWWKQLSSANLYNWHDFKNYETLLQGITKCQQKDIFPTYTNRLINCNWRNTWSIFFLIDKKFTAFLWIDQKRKKKQFERLRYIKQDLGKGLLCLHLWMNLLPPEVFSAIIKTTTLIVVDDLQGCKLHSYLVIQSICRSMIPLIWSWSLLRFLE